MVSNLALNIKTNVPILFLQLSFKFQTLFAPVFIPNKYTRELKIDVVMQQVKSWFFFYFIVQLYASLNAQK